MQHPAVAVGHSSDEAAMLNRWDLPEEEWVTAMAMRPEEPLVPPAGEGRLGAGQTEEPKIEE